MSERTQVSYRQCTDYLGIICNLMHLTVAARSCKPDTRAADLYGREANPETGKGANPHSNTTAAWTSCSKVRNFNFCFTHKLEDLFTNTILCIFNFHLLHSSPWLMKQRIGDFCFLFLWKLIKTSTLTWFVTQSRKVVNKYMGWQNSWERWCKKSPSPSFNAHRGSRNCRCLQMGGEPSPWVSERCVWPCSTWGTSIFRVKCLAQMYM